uniref:Uncharacterized protein n=1 Tax=Sphaerodactylus townsendi TaxID=933632 RepID=A0ACB8EFG4_9SAUR
MDFSGVQYCTQGCSRVGRSRGGGLRPGRLRIAREEASNVNETTAETDKSLPSKGVLESLSRGFQERISFPDVEEMAGKFLGFSLERDKEDESHDDDSDDDGCHAGLLTPMKVRPPKPDLEAETHWRMRNQLRPHRLLMALQNQSQLSKRPQNCLRTLLQPPHPSLQSSWFPYPARAV